MFFPVLLRGAERRHLLNLLANEVEPNVSIIKKLEQAHGNKGTPLLLAMSEEEGRLLVRALQELDSPELLQIRQRLETEVQQSQKVTSS